MSNYTDILSKITKDHISENDKLLDEMAKSIATLRMHCNEKSDYFLGETISILSEDNILEPSIHTELILVINNFITLKNNYSKIKFIFNFFKKSNKKIDENVLEVLKKKTQAAKNDIKREIQTRKEQKTTTKDKGVNVKIEMDRVIEKIDGIQSTFDKLTYRLEDEIYDRKTVDNIAAKKKADAVCKSKMLEERYMSKVQTITKLFKQRIDSLTSTIKKTGESYNNPQKDKSASPQKQMYNLLEKIQDIFHFQFGAQRFAEQVKDLKRIERVLKWNTDGDRLKLPQNMERVEKTPKDLENLFNILDSFSAERLLESIKKDFKDQEALNLLNFENLVSLQKEAEKKGRENFVKCELNKKDKSAKFVFVPFANKETDEVFYFKPQEAVQEIKPQEASEIDMVFAAVPSSKKHEEIKDNLYRGDLDNKEIKKEEADFRKLEEHKSDRTAEPIQWHRQPLMSSSKDKRSKEVDGAHALFLGGGTLSILYYLHNRYNDTPEQEKKND
jgi:hypothetical protein